MKKYCWHHWTEIPSRQMGSFSVVCEAVRRINKRQASQPFKVKKDQVLLSFYTARCTVPCKSTYTTWTLPQFIVSQPETSVWFTGILCDDWTDWREWKGFCCRRFFGVNVHRSFLMVDYGMLINLLMFAMASQKVITRNLQMNALQIISEQNKWNISLILCHHWAKCHYKDTTDRKY